MENYSHITCPVCNENKMVLRYEATYVYSYLIDSDAPGIKNKEEFLSFLYDSREQKESEQYVQCLTCDAKFITNIHQRDKGIDTTSLQNMVDLKNMMTK